MPYHDIPYLRLMSKIFEEGQTKENRTGTDTLSIFGPQMEFDLSDGTIPLLTTKQIHIKSIIYELLWFLSGSTNVKDLQKNGVTIWDEWADENGELGPVYGKQWRDWTHVKIIEYGNEWSSTIRIDQIDRLVNDIKTDPNSRRLIVSAWNVGELSEMKLPPCHCLFQCYVSADGKLSLKIYQRSCDFFLGVPFNIAQYGILLHMLAHVCDLKVGNLIWTGGDVHLYVNHITQAKTQLSRYINAYPSPTLKFTRKVFDIFDFKYDDFEISDYVCYSKISAPVSK